jgi:hypothetical protein
VYAKLDAPSSSDTSGRRARLLADISAAAASGARELDLSNRGILSLPPEIGSLVALEKLNLANNPLSNLPDEIAGCVNLRTLFFLGNAFTEVPPVVGRLPRLRMLSFKSNRLALVAEDALAPSLEWLILTDNALTALPASLGRLRHLRKLMLASNRLEALPDVSGLASLELVRLSDNALRAVPAALFALPRLAWIALGGNELGPLRRGDVPAALAAAPHRIDFARLRLGAVLGEGASGVVHVATLDGSSVRGPCGGRPGEVAVKIFKAASSDGRPIDEVTAAARIPPHDALINLVGFVDEGAGGRLATVLEYCETLLVLGRPPSFDSVTRDVFGAQPPVLSVTQAAWIARDVAAACAHLHAAGIMHGDVYAHNVMVDAALVTGDGAAVARPTVKLGDLGAAFFYDRSGADAAAIERIEMRGYACFIDDLLGLVAGDDSKHLGRAMRALAAECGAQGNDPAGRPTFRVVVDNFDRLLS